jgi:molybdopterin converting factor small subunit
MAQFAAAPVLTLELPSGSTVEDVFRRLASSNPELAPALRSALPIVGGTHVERGKPLAHGDELALLAPVSGG